MKAIGEMLPQVMQQIQTGSLAPVRQEPKQLKTFEEEVFSKALQDKKIGQCSYEEFKETLKYCVLLVGLRAHNFPTDEEKKFLFQYTRANYGKHTLPEIRLAFDMAIQGKLDLEEKDVKCYENFSVQYFSSILNAYRKWAAQAHDQLTRTAVPELEYKTPEIDWRGIIEKEYQKFLSGEKCLWTAWPSSFYDQAVFDGYIQFNVYREHMKQAKQALIGDLDAKLAVLETKSNDDVSERYVDHQGIQNKIIEYRNGSRDAEVVLVSKQYCVLMMFAKAKEAGYTKLYEPDED